MSRSRISGRSKKDDESQRMVAEKRSRGGWSAGRPVCKNTRGTEAKIGLRVSAFCHYRRDYTGLRPCGGGCGEGIWRGPGRAARLVEEKHRQPGRKRSGGSEKPAGEIRFAGDGHRKPA